MLALTLTLALLAQAPTPAATPDTVDGRTAAAAERTAVAAEKTAEAVNRLAEVLAPRAGAAEAAPAKKPETWVGTVGAGLTFITGNSQTLTLTGSVAADRKWTNWALGIRAAGAYGLSNPTANVAGSVTSTTARRANATVRGDRNFGTFASLFILGGMEADHMKSIESRSYGEFGTGLLFFNEKQGDRERLFVRLDIALRAGYETRFVYFPTPAAVDPYGIIILAPRVAGTFRWSLNQHLRVSEELEVIPFLLAPDAGRVLFNSTTKLNTRITENVALSLSLLVGYDSQPPPATPARVTTDVALTAGVEASF